LLWQGSSKKVKPTQAPFLFISSLTPGLELAKCRGHFLFSLLDLDHKISYQSVGLAYFILFWQGRSKWISFHDWK
jgi:hypothetical protein